MPGNQRTFSKWLPIIITSLVGLVLVITIIREKNLFSFFRSRPLTIEETPLVVSEIKQIAQLNTARLYVETVLDSIVPAAPSPASNILRGLGVPAAPSSNSRRMVLIVRGEVIAGLDLDKMDTASYKVMGDSVHLSLPPAEYLDVIINPSGYEVFLSQGEWKMEEVQAVLSSGKRKLIHEADQQNLLNKADDQAATALKAFVELMGYKKVSVGAKGS